MKRILFPNASDLLGESTEMRWVLKPLLVPGSSMMLYGRQGIGKSTIMLQLAAAFAAQTDWLVFPTLAKGATLWLQLDMPRAELRQLLIRADQSQLFQNGTRDSVKFAQFWDDDQEVFDFDILADNDHKLLMEAVQDIRPLCLMVDTGNDVYQARQHKEAGAEVRKVLRRLRAVMGQVGGVTVYSQHQRKRQLGVTGDDPDAFLGRVEWETVASSSVQLESSSRGEGEERLESFLLTIRKHRLAEPGFRELALVKGPDGFFAPKWTATTALACWPRCVPEAERSATGRDDIFMAIEKCLKIEHSALKVAAGRLRGQVPWKTT